MAEFPPGSAVVSLGILLTFLYTQESEVPPPLLENHRTPITLPAGIAYNGVNNEGNQTFQAPNKLVAMQLSCGKWVINAFADVPVYPNISEVSSELSVNITCKGKAPISNAS